MSHGRDGSCARLRRPPPRRKLRRPAATDTHPRAARRRSNPRDQSLRGRTPGRAPAGAVGGAGEPRSATVRSTRRLADGTPTRFLATTLVNSSLECVMTRDAADASLRPRRGSRDDRRGGVAGHAGRCAAGLGAAVGVPGGDARLLDVAERVAGVAAAGAAVAPARGAGRGGRAKCEERPAPLDTRVGSGPGASVPHEAGVQADHRVHRSRGGQVQAAGEGRYHHTAFREGLPQPAHDSARDLCYFANGTSGGCVCAYVSSCLTHWWLCRSSAARGTSRLSLYRPTSTGRP